MDKDEKRADENRIEQDNWKIKRMEILDPELRKLQEELFSDEGSDKASGKGAKADASEKTGETVKSRASAARTSGRPEALGDGDGKDAPSLKGHSRRKKGFLERLTENAGEGMGESGAEEQELKGQLVMELMKHRLYVFGALAFLIAVIALAFLASSALRKGLGGATASDAAMAETEAPEAETQLSEEELRELELQNMMQNELSAYTDLGIVDVSGYINLRSAPDVLDMTNIIGELSDGAVCSILAKEGDWYQIESGGMTGYASAQYIITGDEAIEMAKETFKDRAIIETEVLNIRSAPTVDAENVIGKARVGERYEVISLDENDWAKINMGRGGAEQEGYIYVGDGNAVIRYCLNEAKRLDLREMALTQFDNLVVANTDGYINIRETPEDDGINNICGQFPEHAGAELLETVENDGRTWYKISSGGVTGYVSAEYCVTGNAARNIAVEAAQLTAYITTDALNVRTEPSLDAEAWTQVTRNQSYHVLDQLDGWVEIELDSTDDESSSDRAFVSTRDNNVEVTYGLPTAIEYYPAVEAANAEMAFRNKIVNYAVQFVGNPYVWGGTSLTNGCDCSGFTQSVLKHFGISIPRVSRDQARSGVRVTSATMRPGDLIFYANSSGTINHVAMYIGNGQVVNAASSRSGIRIYRWNYRTPVAIRDVIGDRTG